MKNIKYLTIILISALTFNACNDYVGIEDAGNPNAPIDVPINGILTASQLSLANDFAYSLYHSEVLQAYTHQMVIREEGGRYDASTGNIPNQNSWDNFYSSTLKQLNSVIERGTMSDDMKYVGIAKILKAYAFTRAVDLWGDIPFSEAGLGPNISLNPSFEDDQQIYAACIDLINEGLGNLSATATNNFTPGSDDIFYGGSISKWTKFANTLKLNLYNKVRDTSLYDSSEVNSLLTSGNLMSSIEDDFELKYRSVTTPADQRNPLFRDEYGGGQITHYISPFIYEMQKGWNPNIFNGIEDPRMPYYYVNQLLPNQTPTNAGDYHDTNTGFLSIRFGSIGPAVDAAQRTSATMVGNYIAGGKFDDGSGGVVGISDGNGYAPLRMLTYYDRYFIEAELIQTGLVSGNSSVALQNGINAAFEKVNQIASYSSISAIDNALKNSYITAVMTEFAAANTSKKLEIIMTQKWLANFGNPLECYNDYRRTGFPVWPDPNGSSPEYALPGLDDSETFISRSYPFSEFWPSTEINSNSNAPAQKTPASYKVFWDN